MTSPDKPLPRKKDDIVTSEDLSPAEREVIDLAYRLGDALVQSDTASRSFIPVPGSGGISVMTSTWINRRGDDFLEETQVALMRHGWMDAAIGSGAAVFEGNISDYRSEEIKRATGVFPNHVVAIGAHMDSDTMEAARAHLERFPDSGFETDYYIGRNGVVKVCLVPTEIDTQEGTFSDIESLASRRFVKDTDDVDLELMEAIMNGFITDILNEGEAGSNPKELTD